jgi:BlaI family transcriptional regulator, penicillinase repressor
MEKPQFSRLGELQLEILKLLWRNGWTRVAEVHKELGTDRYAYTTIATMLRKMDERGLVRHQERGRTFFYAAAMSERDVTRSTAADLVDRVFEGDLANAVSHLLDVREVHPEELDRLEQLIRQRKLKGPLV